MVINGLTQAQINAQVARLERILLRREVALTRLMRREIIRLWRQYDNLDAALIAFNERIAQIIQDEAEKTADVVGDHIEAQLVENGSTPLKTAVLAGLAGFFISRARESAEQVTQTERENIQRLARVLAEGGLTPAQITAAIRERAPTYSAPRARLIAEMETRAVADEFTKISLEESGLEFTAKIWISAGDNRVREDHRDANGQRVDFDQPFTVGDDQLLDPRDGSLGAGADQILRCRCVANYLIE